jgi:hypothetical protein
MPRVARVPWVLWVSFRERAVGVSSHHHVAFWLERWRRRMQALIRGQGGVNQWRRDAYFVGRCVPCVPCRPSAAYCQGVKLWPKIGERFARVLLFAEACLRLFADRSPYADRSPIVRGVRRRKGIGCRGWGGGAGRGVQAVCSNGLAGIMCGVRGRGGGGACAAVWGGAFARSLRLGAPALGEQAGAGQWGRGAGRGSGRVRGGSVLQGACAVRGFKRWARARVLGCGVGVQGKQRLRGWGEGRGGGR